MKIILFLFSCFIMLVQPYMVVHAAEGKASPDQSILDQTETEMTSDERSAYAKSLFEGRCQMCHQLPEPGMLKPQQWKLILTTMQQRMEQAGVPPLTEDETERLLEYLTPLAR